MFVCCYYYFGIEQGMTTQLHGLIQQKNDNDDDDHNEDSIHRAAITGVLLLLLKRNEAERLQRKR